MENQKLGPNQQKWVDALRSGDYSQTKGVLYRSRNHIESGYSHNYKPGYCCLGVAQKIFNPKERDKNGTMYLQSVAKGSCSMSVVGELALVDSNGACRSADFEYLSEMNDSGDTFEDIADHLESYAYEYFTEAK